MTADPKPDLRKANDNPWYCLATLYGEQPIDRFDADLAAKNRIAWNRWAAGALSNETRISLTNKGIPGTELTPFAEDEQSELLRLFAARTGTRKAPPDPAGEADFSSTLYDRPVDFARFRFPGGTTFRLASFSGSAYFGPAVFSGSADFGRAVFSRSADFGSAVFSRSADFRSATFSRYADFRSTTFSRYANFQSAEFLGTANFRNAEFNNQTVFTKTRFLGSVPDFRGGTLHEATELDDVYWPLPPKDTSAAKQQVNAYERLKQEMERLKKHEDELFFFRKELRARRGMMPFLSGRWILNALYQASSNYGESIVLPLLWLFGLGEAQLHVLVLTPVLCGKPMALPNGIALVFGDTFRWLPGNKETLARAINGQLSYWALFVGDMRALLSVVFIFLLGLAVRNRFRMK